MQAREVFRLSVVASLGVTTVGLLVLAVYAVRGVLVLAFIALFVAISLDPAVRLLCRRGMRRGWAVALIFGLSFLALVGLVAAIGPPLVRQGINLSREVPDYIDRLTAQSKAIRDFGARYGVTDQLRELAATVPARIGSNVLHFVRTFFGAMVQSLLVIVLTLYFMAALPQLQDGVVRLVPHRSRQHVRRAVEVTVDKVGAYMIGNVLISLVAGVAAFVCLAILRVPFALPLALVVALADLIPMIGATLGAIVCVVVAAISVHLWPAVAVAVFFLLYQQLENYLVAPRILRNTVDLPAVAVLLAGLIGAAVLGIVGALMAIPVAAVIKVLGSSMISDMDQAEAAALRAAGGSDPAAGGSDPVPSPAEPATRSGPGPTAPA
jgi:predicted PurR-regulated permease PerM